MFKTILNNTFAQLVAKAFSVLTTFVTTLLIIRVAGPDLYGDLTKALSLIAIGFTAIDFGLNAIAVRLMSQKPKQSLDELSKVVAARLYLSILAILFTNLIVWFLPGGYTSEIKRLFWLGSLAIIFQGLFTSYNAWFQAKLSYWRAASSTIVGSLVGALSTYLAIRYLPTLGGLLIASSLGYFSMALVSYLFSPRDLNLHAFRLQSVLSTLRGSLILGSLLVLSVLASKLDVVIMGISRTSAEVGQYGFAYRIFDVALVLPIFVMNAVYPLLLGLVGSKQAKLIKNSSYMLLIIGLIGSVLLYLLAPQISSIRPDMQLSISTLRILCLALPIFYLTAPLMWQLISLGLEKYLLHIYGIAAILNGALNYLLIPGYGPLSAAYITGLTELFILVGLVVIKKYFNSHNS